MSLADNLKSAQEQAEHKYRRSTHPQGWEPGLEFDGDTGVITTEPLAGEPEWADVLSVWGLDPQEYEIVGSPQFRAWDVQGKHGIERLFYYRANVSKRAKRVDVDALVKQLRKCVRKPVNGGDGKAFVHPVGDLQIGEWTRDGGTEFVVDRFMRVTDEALRTLKLWRKLGRVGGDVYLPWLGDCIQGFNSQNGRLAWRTDATLVEQFRIYRRLVAYQVEVFAPFAERLVVVGIPGNHDEAVRVPANTRYDDSWAIEGVVAVADAFKRVPGYEHVSFVTPQIDDLSVTLDMCGTVVGMVHGHQWKGDSHNAHGWWAKQAHGRTSVGDADVLLCGHRHHLYVQEGGAKVVIQSPALIGESAWWVNKAGDRSRVGAVCLTVGGGSWGDLTLLG